MQQQLQILSDFCSEKDLEVNLSKTEAVVFRPASRSFNREEWQWTYKGAAVPISQEFKYLGIVFHKTQGLVCLLLRKCFVRQHNERCGLW